jgi:hypothetical protein
MCTNKKSIDLKPEANNFEAAQNRKQHMES